ncbi:peptidoglycan-binding protein [Streptomyces sp. ISL-112]|uniref:peptidoglycan-binding domain-containing protein n=1 Tax=unclassified Streptomyces TaxID=2593676 RepID=UPI001BE9DAF8|nr:MULTISPECIES: peptidoglycan-binding domain-containing protein [unclassified Streptomyces]MBT2424660.1 peptidoglycan-binding protein [Streptomyces sp. ISL-112]MBT2462230.1 peptidoglycan-binding protein [Streptomyces sp. ISL-63]
MRNNRLPRRTLAALAAAFLLASPATAHAAAPPPPPVTAQGLRAFQQSYGLTPTGLMDTATAHLLKTAPDSELRAAFADPSDLGPEQLAHARTVIGVGKGADLPEQGQVIALMTAMQESTFVNYTTPVDHDSLGVFQQRPSMGWGTPQQITHVPTASKSFYGLPSPTSNPGLLQIKGWESMEPGKACQAVQRSAHPDRYAQWEQFARDLLEREGPTVEPVG